MENTKLNTFAGEPAKGDISSESNWMKDISDQARSFEKQFNSFVVQRPWVIMGAALTAGYLGNLYLNSRASSQASKVG